MYWLAGLVRSTLQVVHFSGEIKQKPVVSLRHLVFTIFTQISVIPLWYVYLKVFMVMELIIYERHATGTQN